MTRQAAVRAKRSIVSVLSVDLVDSTGHIAACDPDDAQAFQDRCQDHVRRAVEHAGGQVVDFTGDGAIAVFGWPKALEDHADQACHAAWLVQQPGGATRGPGGADVHYRVGVHSGLVALRELRDEQRPKRNAAGAVVNIAAKLQQAARPGSIIVSEETVRLCMASDLALSPLAKPKADVLSGLRAFSLDGRPHRPTHGEAPRRYDHPLVGRAEELLRLRAQLRDDAPCIATALIGEPGIGKSRLAAAVAAEAAAAGARTLFFYGQALKAAAPFAAARALFLELLRLPPAPSLEELEVAISFAALSHHDVEAIVTLFADTAERAADNGQTTPTQVARALVNIVAAVANSQSLLLVVEDLHLIDHESLHFLQALGSDPSLRDVRLLLTARAEATRAAQRITDEVIVVGQMSRDDMVTLARLIWLDDEPAPETIDTIVARAEGVPFALEQLVWSARTGAAVDRDLPPGVESLVHARLQQLAFRTGVAEVVEALTVLGSEADPELVQRITAISPARLKAGLATLRRHEFLTREGPAIQFRHQIIADACASTVPGERRASLHGAAFDALADVPMPSAARRLQLAAHARGAGRHRAAFEQLWEAGAAARGTTAAASLHLIFDQALEVVGQTGADADKHYVNLVIMAFPSMLLLGEFEKMRTHLPRVVEAARRLGRPDKLSACQSQFGMFCWFEGRYQEGLTATEEGAAAARALGAPALVFANQIMTANVLHGLGRIDRALAELAALEDLLRDHPEHVRWGSPALPHSMTPSFMGWIMLEDGRYDEALSHAERGLAVALRQSDPYSEVMARNAIGRILLRLRRDGEAAECLQIASQLAESNGYDATKANLAGHLTMALARLGRLEEARETAETCLGAGLDRRTGRMEQHVLRAGYAEALLRAGRLEQGAQMMAEALAIAEEIDNPCLIAAGLALRAAVVRPGAQPDGDRRRAAELWRRHNLAPWSPSPYEG